jgi:hypothetical protein
MQKIKNLSFSVVFVKFVSGVTMVALLSVSVLPQLANALAITSSKDTATRLQISTTADHSIVFTLPTGIDLDRAGNTDTLQVDFPAAFTLGGTWVAGDFTFNDGTARTISAVAQGAGTIDCTPTGGANDVCVAVDTTNNIFTIEVGASYTASATGATVTFTIDGTATDGTLTNPGSVAATNIDFKMCDETAGCPAGFTTVHSSQIAFGVIDDDTVAVTATVNSSLTFDMDTTAADTCGTTETAAPYVVALGTITNSDTRISGATDTVNNICIDLDTNAGGGAVVTINNANGASGLVSTSTPASDIDSSDGSVGDNTENYGVCIVTTSAASGTFDDAGGYNGDTCAANSETNNVQALSTVPEDILDTDGAPIATGRAQIAVNASITIAQPAHNDYTDALTFIATGTF